MVQVNLPVELGEAVEREVAAGRAVSAEACITRAIREYLLSEDELAAEARAGIEDFEAGRYVEVDDLEAWGAGNLERVWTAMRKE